MFQHSRYLILVTLLLNLSASGEVVVHALPPAAEEGHAVEQTEPWIPPKDDSRPGNAALRLFAEISKISRGSGKEGEIRNWLAGKAKAHGKQTCIDEAGNLVIELPASSPKYAQRPTVALQSHMDMVWTVKDSEPDADLAPYFRNGVRIEKTGGWIHSEGHRTTLGADDGIGMAMGLRYLFDPRLPHGPMELVFTVSEEKGLVGARSFGCELKASQLINLDGADSNLFYTGSQGVDRNRLTANFHREPVPEAYRYLKIKLKDFKGGHSGAQIHLKRANAVLEAAKLIEALHAEGIDARLVSASGGNAANAIPSGVDLNLAVPASQVEHVRQIGRRLALETLHNYPGETEPGEISNPDKRFQLSSAPPPADRRGISARDTELLAKTLLKMKNGVMHLEDFQSGKRSSENESAHWEDGYPERVRLSSNLGTFSLKGTGNNAVAEVNLLSRSFHEEEGAWLVNKNRSTFKEALVEQGAKVAESSTSPSFVTDPSSPLFKLARAEFPKVKFELAPGGAEPSEFKRLFPKLSLLLMGPTIESEHSSDEKLSLEGVQRSTEILDRLIERIANGAL